MARIKLENLVKTFGPHVTAVAGVNLDINDGEFMILVGPSGCGKTTTLNMISGLEQPTEYRKFKRPFPSFSSDFIYPPSPWHPQKIAALIEFRGRGIEDVVLHCYKSSS